MRSCNRRLTNFKVLLVANNGVMLCILSPAVPAGLAGFIDESGDWFIRGHAAMKKYKYIGEGTFYTDCIFTFSVRCVSILMFKSNNITGGCSLVVKYQLPKLRLGVRFPSSAPKKFCP